MTIEWTTREKAEALLAEWQAQTIAQRKEALARDGFAHIEPSRSKYELRPAREHADLAAFDPPEWATIICVRAGE